MCGRIGFNQHLEVIIQALHRIVISGDENAVCTTFFFRYKLITVYPTYPKRLRISKTPFCKTTAGAARKNGGRRPCGKADTH